MLSYPYFWQRKSSISSYLLLPFSWLFRLGSFIRKCFSNAHKIDGLVICVGNATVGGTGKTQIIKWLAKYCAEKKLNFVIISKGFGSCNKEAVIVDSSIHKATDVGDEALEMQALGQVISARDITQAIPLIDKIKSDGFLRGNFIPDKFIILVDDGMQNPNFVKDITIMTVDASRGFGNGRIIPAGPLRESPINAINRSDVIIFVGNGDSKELHTLDLIPKANHLKKEPLILQANIKFKSPTDFMQSKYIAFCGIGNPERFFYMLEKQAIEVIEKIPFADHHNYHASEINNLCSIAQKAGAKLITTRKDFSRLQGLKVDTQYMHLIDNIEAVVDFGNSEEKLSNMLDRKIFGTIQKI